jgi:dTDP-4-dehydrorhamnose 3,5-epimerase
MQIETTRLDGVLILTPKRFADDRGFFSETWNKKQLATAGIEVDFVQDNHSFSAERGTVRGLHYQKPPHAQDKLVRVLVGGIIDVAVDVRSGSPTYGQSVSVELSADNGKQLLVPKGFLHGFATLVANTEVAYKVSDFYAPDCDGSIRFDDPDLNIDWKLAGFAAVLSAKDAKALPFAAFQSPFTYRGEN